MKNETTTHWDVLLVEDDNDLRAAIGQFLETSGYNVTKCGSCREALAVLQNGASFQILLADLMLPDGEGLEIMKAAQKKDPNVLAAIMTGYASLETALKAIRLGAYDYLTKPFSFEEIEILLRNMTDKLQLVRENRAIERKLEQLYANMDVLQREKVDLTQSNRELNAGFTRVLDKLDQMTRVLYDLAAARTGV